MKEVIAIWSRAGLSLADLRGCRDTVGEIDIIVVPPLIYRKMISLVRDVIRIQGQPPEFEGASLISSMGLTNEIFVFGIHGACRLVLGNDYANGPLTT